jgi:hypothetical protein
MRTFDALFLIGRHATMNLSNEADARQREDKGVRSHTETLLFVGRGKIKIGHARKGTSRDGAVASHYPESRWKMPDGRRALPSGIP